MGHRPVTLIEAQTLIEVQIDRLVGPTHHFGGLGVGNIASQKHAGQPSNPQAAAMQGLDKMKLVASLGVPQLILPPQPRPEFDFLRRVGFRGNETQILREAYAADMHLFSASLSSSAMWVANAATASAGVDNRFGNAALTVANLDASLHRAIEPAATFDELMACLPKSSKVLSHLMGGAAMRDEGAANHMRLGTGQNEPGIHVFVYGDGDPSPHRRWPRQTRAACEAISRQHGLAPDDTFYLKQHPAAIDAGAFHNDVVAASHQNILLHHELAFHEGESTIADIARRYQVKFGCPLQYRVVTQRDLPLEDAVSTYLFNSQIVSTPESETSPAIICPSQVQQHDSANNIVERWCEQGLFGESRFIDLSQSMSGGGGPACLRLRVPMTRMEIDQTPATSRWSDELDQRLRAIITALYPTAMHPAELIDPATLQTVIQATTAVRELLQAD